MHKVVEKSPCGRFVRYNETLGCGGYKDVYLGFDHVRKIEVAWNQIVFEGEDEELKTPEALFSEAILLKSLNHDRIMKCFAYWFDSKSKTLNMTTELFSSGSLKKHVLKCNGTSGVGFDDIKNWGRQILEGLSFLHSQSPKLIHRDIKCDNVFVRSGGEQVALGDLGLAIHLYDGNFAKEVKGTPEFMAPEYYDEEYNELVDVYAFGMCLLEMVTGECPYKECSNQLQIFRKVTTGIKPVSLGMVKDSRVKDVIEKCLLPLPTRPSAKELLKDQFFRCNNSGFTMEACSPIPSFVPFRGLHCCARDLENLYLF